MKARESAWKHQLIVLLVDEAQNIPADSAQARAVISYLHSGARKARILLACYGLGNTQNKLAELGVSRLACSRLTTLQPLAVEQARESISRVFSSCGVAGPAPDRWLEALAARGMNLSASSLEAVIQAGRAARKRYYDQRLSGVMLWLPVYREIAEALRRANASHLRLDQIAEIACPHLARWDLSLEEFLSRTLRAGVLGNQDSRYSIPILSFADHLRRI